jgi:thioredoxin reductase
MEQSSEFEYLIIGAGPAGLQLGYFFEEGGRDYMILEAQERPGSFFVTYPRSRTLISFNKVFSIYDDPEIQLRWDWNSLLTNNYDFLFREYSKRLYPNANEMIQYLSDFASHYSIKIKYGTRVIRVSRDEKGIFHLKDQNRNIYSSRCLIVATGFSKAYIPDIPGIEFAEGYEDVSMNPDDFLNQRVFIIGKGNSGFEIAHNILETASLIHLSSGHSIQLAWNTKHPGHLRADYTKILDTYQLKLLNSALDCVVNRIEPKGDKFTVLVTYIHANGETEEMLYDRVIRCTGFQFDTSIFDTTCRPSLAIAGRFPDLTSAWESANIKNLFFAGTLMQMRDYKRASSAFIDGFRYNIRSLYHLLEKKHHQKPLPSCLIEATDQALVQATLDRICRTSALWAQFGHLCDVIVVDERSKQARYYFELPVDYVHDSELGQNSHYYTITFEWGTWQGDVFAIDRHPGHEQAHRGAFLHPIVRRFTGSSLLAEHHMLEDLFGMYCHAGTVDTRQSISSRKIEEYHAEEHMRPLHQFFTSQLQAIFSM